MAQADGIEPPCVQVQSLAGMPATHTRIKLAASFRVELNSADLEFALLPEPRLLFGGQQSNTIEMPQATRSGFQPVPAP
jgi:hypothetical protein